MTWRREIAPGITLVERDGKPVLIESFAPAATALATALLVTGTVLGVTKVVRAKRGIELHVRVVHEKEG